MIEQEPVKPVPLKDKVLSRVRIPKFDVKEFPTWWRSLLWSWKHYFVSLPERLKSLSRREIRVQVARYLLAIVLTYFIVGIVLGFGYYTKRLPLNNTFGWFGATIYPFPAEIVGLQAVTLKGIADQEKIIYFFAESSGSKLGNRLEIDKKIMESDEELLLAQKALAKYNVKVTKKDIDEVMKKIEDENGGKEQVTELLKSLYGINIAQFREIVEEQLVKDKVNTDVLKTVKVRHILVGDEGKAKELKEKIEKGEIKFEDAAKENSKDSATKDKGGQVTTNESSEYVGRDSGLAKEFIDVMYKTKKGKISAPFQTEFGWHILQVQDIKGSVNKNYEDWLKDTRSKTIIWKIYRP